MLSKRFIDIFRLFLSAWSNCWNSRKTSWDASLCSFVCPRPELRSGTPLSREAPTPPRPSFGCSPSWDSPTSTRRPPASSEVCHPYSGRCRNSSREQSCSTISKTQISKSKRYAMRRVSKLFFQEGKFWPSRDSFFISFKNMVCSLQFF